MSGRVTVAIVTAAIMLTSSCAQFRRIDRPPSLDAYCVHAYHACDKCGSLQGGIYNKGPFKRFPGPEKASCQHEWREIVRDEFKELASQNHGVDWSQESAMFWKN